MSDATAISQAQAESVPAADRPAPPKPSVKVVSSRKPEQRPTLQREGKASENRRAAAIKAMGKLQAAANARPAGTRESVAEALGADPNDVDASPAGEDAPLAAEVLAGGEPEEVDEGRAKILEARQAAAKRVADFERKRAERRANYQRSQKDAQERAALEARERDIAQTKENLRLAQEKPFEFLAKSGIAPTDLVKEAVNAGDPEALTRKELAELKAWKADQEKRIEDWQKEEERKRFVSTIEQFERRYLEMVKEKPADYPTLRRYSPDYVNQRCRIASQLVQKESGLLPGSYEGAPCTQAEILTYVQDQILTEEAAVAASVSQPETPRVAPKAAGTITGSLSTRSTASARKLSKADRIERAKGMMRAGTRR